MSVHAYQTKDGERYQVRWREAGRKVRTRTFASKREAAQFDIDVKARRNRGEVVPRTSKQTLGAAYDEWHHFKGERIAATTLRSYDAMWNAHIKGRFDDYTLAEVVADPQILDRILADMRERGVGNAAQRRVCMVLSGVFTTHVRWNRIPNNPIRDLEKPRATRLRHPHPFPPIVVERIRLRMMRRRTLDPKGIRATADACFVSLMSYAGMRPAEALALTWDDIGAHTIEINKAVRDAEEAPTKTGGIRTVPLSAPLQADLDDLYWASGAPRKHGLVIPSIDGDYWTPSEIRNWRNRVWKPILKDLAAEEALKRLASARPYDCRGTFVSLHLRAGENAPQVAEWAGHSMGVMFKHYANVIKELDGERKLVGGHVSVEDQIMRARETVEAKERQELDALTADILENPTIPAAERDRERRGESEVDRPIAARMLYAPSGR